jgi:uncharacterized RDD family membrane protein YckC
MNRAGFLSRFLAFLIDNIALGVIAWLLSLVLVPLTGVATQSDGSLFGMIVGVAGMVVAFILLLLQFLYFGWLWSTSGQSLGMRVTNIRVVRRDGSSLSLVRAGLRGTVGYWISGLIFGLGFIWAAFDGRKEAWHDKLFDTAVLTA